MLWALFLFWTLPIGLVVAIEKLRIFAFWKNYFVGFFIFALVYYTIDKRIQIKALIIGLIVWGLSLAIIEFKVLIDLGGFSAGIVGLYLKKNLLSITWGRSNYLASFFVLIIPITIGYLFYTKSFRLKIFTFFSLIIMSFAVMLTLSRGGILALAIALIILSFRTLKTKTLVPFLALIFILILVVLLNPLTYVIIEGVSNLETSGSVYTRINFYEDTWRAFLNYPITGVGFGNLGYYSTFILAEGTSFSAHNIVLGMLGEVGLVGGIFFFLILGSIITNLFKEFLEEKDNALKVLRWSFLSSIIGGCLHSLVEPTFEGFQFSIIFWLIVGISSNLHQLKSNSN
ncbi:MAG: O-antigen ligase family protein [Ignavibacteria bacterium]|nr:O-antigen ligase family protein [Ignavibacteria bacterium]MBT8383594.1 O-antigen ligase family protein [Ignavibacteria bacterium]MBT8392936.1 O-antigen ligase family protein [Ignavibacteria bacterium]NNL20727.1 O-antigen ligase family protein [Ignavibacteriaceae bacterium]